MAKGNPFLGTSSGSVGDVTLYRRNGEQISRVRVRQVANPKTSKQVYTRAILATVAKAYSAGHVIFDHAFEGEQVPSGAQRYFLRENLRMLRANIAADRDADLEAPFSNPLVGKNAPYPVVGKYVVSHGSLYNSLVRITPGTPDTVGVFYFGSSPGTGGSFTWGSFYDSLGLEPGDIYTFVFFSYSSLRAMMAGNYVAEFGFLRLSVKDLTENQRLLTTTPRVSDFFSWSRSSNVNASASDIDWGENRVDALSVRSGAFCQSLACIRSREDSGLRSSEQMVYMIGDDIAGTDGTYWANVNERWSDGVGLGESSLILEGGGERRGENNVHMTTTFEQPITLAGLGALASPQLVFSIPVTAGDLRQHLRLASGSVGFDLYINSSFEITDGADTFGQIALSSTGMSATIEVDNTAPTHEFSFVWN